MKQRIRIRRIKARLYPWYVYIGRQRMAWGAIYGPCRRLSEAFKEVYGQLIHQSENTPCH